MDRDEALADHWKGQCNRYMNGQCSTRRCLMRGGYSGKVPVDFALATCEEHETVVAIAKNDALVAALERSAKAGERVLAAMDAHNEKHETHLGGPAFFEIGRAVAQAREALTKHGEGL